MTEVQESESKVEKPWLIELADGLSRVRFDDDDRTAQVRRIAERLRQTTWKPFRRLEVTPYMDGTPAGTPITPRVLWHDVTLYVAASISIAKLHKELADELARPFGDRTVAEAITACIERNADYVAEYLADQFELDEQVELQSAEAEMEGGVEEDSPATGNTATEGGPGTVEEPSEKAAVESNDEDDAEPSEPEDGFGASADEPEAAKLRKASAPAKPDLMVEMSRDGNPILRLWVQNQTLAEGVELPHEIWSLLRSEPTTSALVVKGGAEEPVALTGREIAEYLLTSRPRVRLFQHHRTLAPWAWPNTTPRPGELRVVGLPSQRSEKAGEVAICFHLSASVQHSDIPIPRKFLLRIIDIGVPDPSIHWLKSPNQLDALGSVATSVFAALLRSFPNASRWHIFFAGPAPGAVKVGQQLNPTMTPPTQLYEFNHAANPRYAPSILLTPPGTP